MGVNCVKTGGGRIHCVHYIEQKNCIRLDSLQGLKYEIPD